MSVKPTTAAGPIVDWMIDAALGTSTVEEVFVRMLEMLRDEEIPVERAYLAHPTLHPLHHGTSVVWRPGAPLQRETYSRDRDPEPQAAFLRSPVAHMIRTDSHRMRRRLTGPGAMRDFPILDDLAAEGMTDYLILGVRFDGFGGVVDSGPDNAHPNLSGYVCSFTTKRPGGFSDEEIATLDWLKRPLAVAVKIGDQREVAESLAACYIGREAGPRVLRGAIRRGDYSATEAVVWLSDLRASTRLSVRLTPSQFVATINEFFDRTVSAVEAEGGEVVTFIGDGALAIFPVERLGAEGARLAALRASAQAQDGMKALNDARGRTGDEALEWGLALHAGAMEYGNLGSATRHAWSVIGPVVNEAARLEALTKTLRQPVLASLAFVSGLREAGRWRGLGAHALAGVPEKMQVFAPPRALIAVGRETARGDAA